MTSCPHCAKETSPGAFCEHCGKALPAPGAGGPRVVSETGFASTRAGEALQSAELHGKAKTAAGALLAVAILQTLAAVLINFVLGGRMEGFEPSTATAVVMFGVAACFYGLWWWARSNPLPAAIVGLVLYVSLLFVDALFDPRSIAKGILVKAIVITVLVKAIRAGAQHRELLKRGAPAGAGV